jgi:hypothetical protein
LALAARRLAARGVERGALPEQRLAAHFDVGIARQGVIQLQRIGIAPVRERAACQIEDVNRVQVLRRSSPLPGYRADRTGDRRQQ